MQRDPSIVAKLDACMRHIIEPLTTTVETADDAYVEHLSQPPILALLELADSLWGMDDAVLVQDAQGAMVYINETAASLCGFASVAEMLAAPIDAVLRGFEIRDERGEPLPLDRLPARRVLAGEAVAEQVIRYRDASSGEERWTRDWATPIRDAQGETQYAVSVFRDITEQKRAEQALQQENRVTTALLAVGATVISELDPDRVIQAVTDAATELTGAEFGAFIYNTLDDAGEAYLRYTLSGAPREAFAHFAMPRSTAIFAPTFRGEGVVRRDDVTQDPRFGQNAPYHGMPEGHPPVCSYLAAPVISRSGDVLGGLFFGHARPGVFTEESERLIVGIAAHAAIAIDNVRLYGAAQASETRYRMLFAQANDAILVFSPRTSRILDANDHAAATYHIAKAGLIGTPITAFSTDAAYGTAQMRAMVADGMPRTLEFVQRRADGTRLDVLAHASVIEFDGEPAILTINHDVTERRQMEEAIRRQNQYLTALHDTSLGVLNRLDVHGLLQAIVTRAGDLLGPSEGYINLVDHGTARLVPSVSYGVSVSRMSYAARPGEGLAGIIWRTGEPLVVNDYGTWSGRLPGTDREQVRAAIGVPLFSGDDVIGVLAAGDTAVERQFGADEVDVLRRFAQLASIALDNARLYTAAQTELHARAQAEEELRESEARYRALFEVSPQPMWVYDTATLAFLAVNEAAVARYGYTREEFLAMQVPDIRDPSEQATLFRQFLNPAELNRVRQTKHRKKDGTVIDVEVISHHATFAERPVRLVVATDVTARAQMEERLRHAALHDPLTGLSNRAAFMEHLGQALTDAKRGTGTHFAVLFLDLDRFKHINDSLGHVYGDRLLAEIAERFATDLDPTCMVARLGGDEFAILAEGITCARGAIAIAEHVHALLAPPIVLRGQEIFVTASIGIALDGRRYSRPEDLLRDADTAMYRAKARGRGQHVVFDAAMHAQAVALLQMESDLWRAIEREELSLRYQPIVALQSGALIGLEALVRWEHPRLGLLAPAEFVPVAEETGQITAIDGWTLREACRQMGRWVERFPTSGGLTVSVNVSGKRFAHPDFVARMCTTLAETGLSADRLKLEITESSLIEHAEAAAAVLAQVRAAGVRVQLDDFGVGYSSLNYLHRFPIDMVKIDRSFISGETGCIENMEIVRAMISLAHNLGIQVITEGVETVAQEEALQRLGCDYAQGWHFGQPLAPEAIGELLMAQGDLAGSRVPRRSPPGSR